MRRRNAVYVRRNVKQVAWHVAIGVGLFFAVRLVWGWQADREYARLAKKLEARGISLDQTQQPGPDNPVTILLHASAAATRLTDSDRRLLDDGDVPYDPKVGVPQWTKSGEARVRVLLAGLESSFAEIDAIQASNQEPLFPPNSIPDFSPIRDLADTMRADALIHFRNHQTAPALHQLRRMLTVSRVVDGDHTVIGHLVAIAIRALASQSVESLEPDLRLSDEKAFSEAGSLVRVLADREELQRRGTQAILSEAEVIRWELKAPRSPIQGWWIRPLRVGFVDRTMDENMAMSPYWSTSDWRGAASAYTKRHPTAGSGDLLDELIYDTIYAQLDRAVLMQCRCISDSAGAAMLLAAQMYKQKPGHYPAVAEEMVPEFLGKVPVDPFDPAGGAMRYRLDADGPTVWSVNENGTDEHAAIRFEYGKREQRYDQQPDLVYGAAWRDAAAGPPTGTKSVK